MSSGQKNKINYCVSSQILSTRRRLCWFGYDFISNPQLTPWNVDTLSKPGFEKTVSGHSVWTMSEIIKAAFTSVFETNRPRKEDKGWEFMCMNHISLFPRLLIVQGIPWNPSGTEHVQTVNGEGLKNLGEPGNEAWTICKSPCHVHVCKNLHMHVKQRTPQDCKIVKVEWSPLSTHTHTHR